MKHENIETPRLLLRGWSMDDRFDLYEYAKGPVVGPSAGWPPHKSISDTRRYIRMLMRSRDCWAVVLKSENKVIGCIGLYDTSLCGEFGAPDSRELGFSLNPLYWGNGYATEAARAALGYAFDVLGLGCVLCAHFDFNLGSKRVCEKCGFVFEREKPCRYDFICEKEMTELVYRLTEARYRFLSEHSWRL